MNDIGIERSGHVALLEIRRPPNNFFDIALIKELADAFESLDDDIHIRAIVLAAQGKAFCAGANFGDGSTLDAQGRRPNEPGPGVAPEREKAARCPPPSSHHGRSGTPPRGPACRRTRPTWSDPSCRYRCCRCLASCATFPVGRLLSAAIGAGYFDCSERNWSGRISL